MCLFSLSFLWGIILYLNPHYKQIIITVAVIFCLIFAIYKTATVIKSQRDKEEIEIKSHLFMRNIAILLIMIFLMISGFIRVCGVDRAFEVISEIDDMNNIIAIGKIESISRKNDKTLLILKDSCIKSQGKWKKVPKIQFSTKKKINPNYKNLIKIKGQAQMPQRASNPGNFDYYTYYKSKGIGLLLKGTILKEKKSENIEYFNGLDNLKYLFENSIEKNAFKSDIGILKSFILGDKSQLLEETKLLYKEGGIIHILCISGLHLSILGLFLYKNLRKAGAGFLLSGSIGGFVILSYVFMTGFTPSSLRAFIMFMLMLLANVSGLHYDMLSAIGFSMIIVLLINPFYVLNTGFVYSFVSVFGIAVFASKTNEKEGEKTNKKKIFGNIKNNLRKNFNFSLSMALFNMPLNAYYNYEINVTAFIINFFVIPFSSILLITAFFASLSGILKIHILTKSLFFTCHIILMFFEAICTIFNRLPFIKILTGKPELINIIIYYLILFLYRYACKSLKDKIFNKNKTLGNFLLPFGKDITDKFTGEIRNNKIKRLIISVAGIIILIFILKTKPCQGFEINVLDIGQGSCNVINDRGRAFVIDAGSSTFEKVGKNRVIPFLKYKGIKNIEYAFATHPDLDHINALEEFFLENIEVKKMVIPYNLRKSQAFKNLLNLAKKSKTKVIFMKRGDKLVKKDFTLTCLHPHKNFPEENENASSLVLELKVGKTKGLFTGDVEKEGEKSLIASNKLKKYDFLLIPHHGSKYTSSDEFLNKALPKISIISAGRGNMYGHPHKEVLDRLKKYNSKIFRTDRDGMISIMIENKKIKVKKYL
ncbi:competence protein ComEC [Acetitomaculum ruminis DSM 5522]|uniref:Competence protein ComEC n=1 Tax=Acetitomaculum ruminis DSM 5522 TaxID=1120918 RepID=A0A1I1ALT8_9FIRM|nr:DNA internalization-related competence protein ComEC/Rec2 [Acetitomaculum ruminis]SFB37293.1 competence protein ComEC [Acetitomaculum ruminis DSM 5522]